MVDPGWIEIILSYESSGLISIFQKSILQKRKVLLINKINLVPSPSARLTLTNVLPLSIGLIDPSFHDIFNCCSS